MNHISPLDSDSELLNERLSGDKFISNPNNIQDLFNLLNSPIAYSIPRCG